MKKFNFKLESVLQVRRLREQQALEALGRAQHEHGIARRRFEVAGSELSEAQSTPLPTHLQQQRELYVYRLRVRVYQLQEDMFIKAGEMERCRLDAVKAQAERKAVDRLRERHLAEWRLEAQREEDRDLSEAAR